MNIIEAREVNKTKVVVSPCGRHEHHVGELSDLSETFSYGEVFGEWKVKAEVVEFHYDGTQYRSVTNNDMMKCHILTGKKWKITATEIE